MGSARNDQVKLLVVDDEPVICESCSRTFESRGFDVVASTDPFEGLRMATSEDFSMILLDLKMPGLDGIEFLRKLRESDPQVPVIIITGYGSLASATAAMRLGATDYVNKPFTPAELLDAVSRGLKPASPVAAAPDAEPAVEEKVEVVPAWEPADGDVRFLGDGWARRGKDGSVRIGMFLSADEAGRVESVHLPRPGDRVYRGVPVAGVTVRGGGTRIIPSPVSGKVREVHRELSDELASGGFRGFSHLWLADIEEPQAAEELALLPSRTVVLANPDAARGKAQIRRLEQVGCKVKAVCNPEEAASLFVGDKVGALFFDDPAAGPDGPQVVRYFKESHPDCRVVVLAPDGSSREGAYRESGAFVFSTGPFNEEDAMNTVASVFPREPHNPALSDQPWSGVLPPWLNRVRVSDRWGKTITLMVSGEMMERHRGLGSQVIRMLLEGGFPVSVIHGAKEHSLAEVAREHQGCDRVVLLEAADQGRVPGSLTRTVRVLPAMRGGEADHLVPCLVVQPKLTGPDRFEFDARTAEALAEQVVKTLTT